MNDVSLSADAVLRDAVRMIEQSRKAIAVIVNDEGRLLGTITDGDIRRALLAGYGMEDPVTTAMNSDPIVGEASMADSYLLDLLYDRGLEALPLLDVQGRLKRVVHISDLVSDKTSGGGEGFCAAVIMAGGEGRRLLPLTEKLPKPMVDVGGMPLIESQVRRLAKAGIHKVYIAVNYLSHMIEDHFGDGNNMDISIDYLREEKKLGTAGALSLLPEPPTGPLMVINGDVLTNSDYRHLFNYHREHQAVMTVAAIDHRIEIPYGVLHTQGVSATRLEEKPAQHFLCNAGIYVVEPKLIATIPRETFFNMTDLIEQCIQNKKEVAVFPIHEYWTDIGTPADLQKARETVRYWEHTSG